MRITCRIPGTFVDTVQDARQVRGAMAQQRIQAVTVFCRLDLACVGRTDSGDAVGKRDTAFDERHLSVELKRV